MTEEKQNKFLEIQGSPFKPRHDWKTCSATIKELLKDGTPKWVSHPEDYREMANEDFLSWKEQSDKGVAGYKLPKQHLLTDKAKSLHRLMGTRDFIKKLRENGVRCFTHQSEWTADTPEWLKNTVGLWAHVPARNDGFMYQGCGHQYICYMAIPCMYEWSLLITDEHNLPAREHRGWRTVLSELIKKDVLTETKAHQIFGFPYGQRSELYQQSLYQFRNRR